MSVSYVRAMITLPTHWCHVTKYLRPIDADPVERRMRENIASDIIQPIAFTNTRLNTYILFLGTHEVLAIKS